MSGNCVIIDFVRTPLCAMGQALSTRTVDQLESVCMEALLQRTGIRAEDLEHTICGHAHMDTDPYNLSRTAWLLARLNENVPGYTVHAGEASGLMALMKAYYLFRSGNDLTAFVGGAESYSRAPYILREARYGVDLDRFPVVDSIPEGERWTQPVPMDPKDLAKALAEEKGYSPDALDCVRTDELDRADLHLWDSRIVPVKWLDRKNKEICVMEDSFPDASDGYARYVDGAVCMLTAEEDKAKELALKPMGRIVGFAWAACSPENRWASVVSAVDKLLSRHAEVKPSKIMDVEILADSAATTLAISEGLIKLGFQPSVFNPNGSSLVWGVNEGGDGVLATGRALLHLQKVGGEYALVAASVGGGESIVMLVQTLN